MDELTKDAYYFPHDSNAKDDPKSISLIEDLSLEGYGIFWVLIETLRDQKDYRAPLKIVPALARRYNTSDEKMLAVIKTYDLFTVEDDQFFFSESLTRRMQPLIEKKYQARVNGIKGNLIRHGHCTDDDLSGLSDSEIIQLNELMCHQKESDRVAIAPRSESGRNKNREEEKIEKKKLNTPPTLEEVIQYFKENSYSREAAEKAFHYYNEYMKERGGKVWKDSNGKTVKSWKQKMRGVWFKPENKINQSNSIDGGTF